MKSRNITSALEKRTKKSGTAVPSSGEARAKKACYTQIEVVFYLSKK